MISRNKATKRSKSLVRLRQLSQLLFFALFLWASHKSLRLFFETNPSLMVFTSIAGRKLAGGILGVAVMLGLTAVLGRFFCGWVCPMGSVIDAVGAVKRRRNGLSESANRVVRRPKYAIWVALLVLALAGIQYAWVLDPITIAGRFTTMRVFPLFAYALDGVFRLGGQLPVVGEWLVDFGRSLSLGEPGSRKYGDAASTVMTGLFLLAAGSAVLVPRLWCRSLCPLGAFYALVGRAAPMERRNRGCTECQVCSARCRMGAIRDDGEYEKGECIMCMDCVYDCPTSRTAFNFSDSKPAGESDGGRGVTRAQFLSLAAVPLVVRNAPVIKTVAGAIGGLRDPIRPPGAVSGGEIGTVCVRCGNCMKVCPTNVIQPHMAGLGDLWTPVMEYSVGSCSYNCKRCGDACPTGAIRRMALPDKRKYVIGVAIVEKAKCYPWSTGEECLVCEEHCPIPDKAIKMKRRDLGGGRTVKCPEIDRNLCNGCGICQNKCPVLPVAIRVAPAGTGKHPGLKTNKEDRYSA